jgi:hypothetical protein
MRSWGRDDSAGRWPSAGPRATIGALVLALLIAGAAADYAFAFWTPTQQRYLREYVRSSFVATSATTYAAAIKKPLGTKGRTAVRTQAALEDLVYGAPLTRLFDMPVAVGAASLALLLCWSIPADLARRRARRLGRQTRGGVTMVDARTFTRRMKGDGLALPQVAGPAVILPRALENSHVGIFGDTRTGKSTIYAHMLDTVAARAERAVVLDQTPQQDFLSRFYRPERGDVILNPTDARSPYWKIGDEVTNDLTARTIAAALIPHKAQEINSFFPDTARLVLAALLKRRPTPQQLAGWLVDHDEIARVVKGSGMDEKKLRNFLDPGAPQQRGGIMGSLNLIVDTLMLCPTEAECRGYGRWTSAEWATQAPGWVFLTSTPETREALVPLQTLWLDLLILRLMGALDRQKTWLMFDELATLNTLPQLHTAVTEGAKSNLVLVFGCQGHTQIEKRYGADAETILSQPATKIFLRGSDAKSSKWASDTIGEHEIERLKESRQDGWARSATTSYGLDRNVEPLVMPSQISGLKNLTGYLKLIDLVTPLRIPYIDRPRRQPGLVSRPARILPMPIIAPSGRFGITIPVTDQQTVHAAMSQESPDGQ